jgi:hypothetical protein
LTNIKITHTGSTTNLTSKNHEKDGQSSTNYQITVTEHPYTYAVTSQRDEDIKNKSLINDEEIEADKIVYD